MLTDNPFFILGVTPRDGKDVIAETFEERAADGDYEESLLMQAQKNLLTSKARLDAEISWFPDLAPKRTAEIVDLLKKIQGAKGGDRKKYQENIFQIVQNLSGVSQANLTGYLCGTQTEDTAVLQMLVQAQQDIGVETIKNAINANRKIAGFPEISEQLVEDALKLLKEGYAKDALQQITAFEHPGNVMTQLVEDFSDAEIDEKRFLEIIAERYDAWAIPKLRDFEDKIDQLIAKAQESEKGYKQIVQDIISLLRQWDEYAQPSQLIYYAKGLDEPRSRKIFDKVRDLALWLANEQQEHQISLELSKASKEIFSELPSVSNRLDDDIGTLEDLVKQANAQEDVAPLAEAVIEAMKSEKALLKSLNKREFNTSGKGAAGKLYKAFIAVTQKTKGSSHEAEPWQLLRTLAIFLNNEKEQPFAAQEIIKALCGLNPPRSVAQVLQADAETMEGNLLSKELSNVIRDEKLGRAIEIVERLITLSKTQEDKQEWQKALETLKGKQRSKKIKWIVWGAVILGLIGLSMFDDNKNSSSSSSKPYKSASTPSTPRYEAPSYTRPRTAPNGQPWPTTAGYIKGYELSNANGLSTVTVDNSRNDSDVFVKLVSLEGTQAYPVRQFYIPAYSRFTLNKITAGNYDIRYRDLSTGGLSRSEAFSLEEIPTYDGVQYSNMTMTLYKISNGNMQTYGISEGEF